MSIRLDFLQLVATESLSALSRGFFWMYISLSHTHRNKHTIFLPHSANRRSALRPETTSQIFFLHIYNKAGNCDREPIQRRSCKAPNLNI